MTENNTKEQDKLTGKVFVLDRVSFQLEAVINGDITRLQVNSEVPSACLSDKNHSGLKITGVMESLPPQYNIGCDCGYGVCAHDANEFYVPFKQLESQDNPRSKINELVEVVDEKVSSDNTSSKSEVSDYASTVSGMSLSAFISSALAGALIDGMSGGIDSNMENLVVSGLAGSLSTALQIAFYNIPGLRFLCPSKGNLSDWEYAKVKTPSSIAGFMVGQTVVKYLKQLF
ncbi:hypothetical protein HZA97_00835 [Candidatus Woesearchaeota archaeon]|nr:hypothetical protein [Candidatus Woesearchaeota archaeon]